MHEGGRAVGVSARSCRTVRQCAKEDTYTPCCIETGSLQYQSTCRACRRGGGGGTPRLGRAAYISAPERRSENGGAIRALTPVAFVVLCYVQFFDGVRIGSGEGSREWVHSELARFPVGCNVHWMPVSDPVAPPMCARVLAAFLRCHFHDNLCMVLAEYVSAQASFADVGVLKEVRTILEPGGLIMRRG